MVGSVRGLWPYIRASSNTKTVIVYLKQATLGLCAVPLQHFFNFRHCTLHFTILTVSVTFLAMTKPTEPIVGDRLPYALDPNPSTTVPPPPRVTSPTKGHKNHRPSYDLEGSDRPSKQRAASRLSATGMSTSQTLHLDQGSARIKRFVILS